MRLTSWAGKHRERLAILGACVVLATLTWLVFAQVRGFSFLDYDDPAYVTDNLRTLGGLSLKNAAWAFRTGAASNWHPLAWLSHMADVSLFGMDPGWHHLTSLAFHIANALLVFCLLRAATDEFWPSLGVAFLFAIHPLHVESVAWVSERKDVLSLFLALLTLASYGRKGTRRPVGMLTLALYALGLMAKPMLVTLPLLMLALDRWPLGRTATWKALVLEKIPLFLLAGASCVVTFVVQQRGGAVISMDHLPLLQRVGNGIMSYGRYLGKMVWPDPLAPFYPFTLADIRPWKVALVLVFLAGVTWLALRARQRRPWLLAGWWWYLVSLLPVIGFVQVGSQAMADRYTYLTLLGPFWIVAWGFRDCARAWSLRPAIQAACAGLGVAALASVAWVQTGYWHDMVTLFRHELQVMPDNPVGRNNLAYGLYRQGRFEEAIPEYLAAQKMMPQNRAVYFGLARSLGKAGHPKEALDFFNRMLVAHEDDYAALEEAAAILVQTGQLEASIPLYKKLLLLEPERIRDEPDSRYPIDLSRDVRMRLGFIYRKLGQDAEAVPFFLAEVEADPQDRTAMYNLGLSLAATGRMGEAIVWLRRCLTLDPGKPSVHFNLAILLERSGSLQAAAKEYQEVLRLQPGNTEASARLQALRKRLSEAGGPA